MGAGVVGRKRHRGGLQRGTLLRGCGSTVLVRRHLPDAEPDRGQSHHGLQRLHVDQEAKPSSSDGNEGRIRLLKEQENSMSSSITKPKPTKPGSKATLGRLFFLDLSDGRVMSANP